MSLARGMLSANISATSTAEWQLALIFAARADVIAERDAQWEKAIKQEYTGPSELFLTAISDRLTRADKPRTPESTVKIDIPEHWPWEKNESEEMAQLVENHLSVMGSNSFCNCRFHRALRFAHEDSQINVNKRSLHDVLEELCPGVRERNYPAWATLNPPAQRAKPIPPKMTQDEDDDIPQADKPRTLQERVEAILKSVLVAEDYHKAAAIEIIAELEKEQ